MIMGEFYMIALKINNYNEMETKKLAVAQATMEYLKNQYSERDGAEQPFFAGCFGIFGHGNLAGY
jgi:3D-(3,5/4)-trihydroxycyclohexane-1,2-dione acylhydrolase (decyclizing)